MIGRKNYDTESDTACICCGNSSLVFSFVKNNDYGEFSITRCTSCSSAFVYPRPDSDKMEAYYRDNSYNDITFEQALEQDLQYHPDSAKDSIRIINRCRKLSNGNRFLDIGAGFGSFTMAAIKDGFTVTACEPNPNARKIFSQLNGFEPDHNIFDKEYALRHEGKISTVLLSQVLEHVTNPEEIVNNILIVLENNGIASIAVPHFGSALSRIQGKNDMYISPPEHLNFFSKKGLVSLFIRNNFKLEFLETVSKVNSGRIENMIGISLISNTVFRGLYGFLKSFDMLGMGMIINAYFRKIL